MVSVSDGERKTKRAGTPGESQQRISDIVLRGLGSTIWEKRGAPYGRSAG